MSGPVPVDELLGAVSRWLGTRCGPAGHLRVGAACGAQSRDRALDACGVSAVAHGPHGQPRFPAPLSGSLTHRGGCSLVVVDPLGRPIGIDLEDGALDVDPVALAAHGEPAHEIGLLLSAKEAAGKALFALCHRRLDPREIRLAWAADDFVAWPAHGRADWGGRVTGHAHRAQDWIASVAIGD